MVDRSILWRRPTAWDLTPAKALVIAAIVLVTGITIAYFGERSYRAQKVTETTVQARILASTVAAALVFKDRNTGQEYVNALQANPEVQAAAIYNADGSLFVGYSRSATAALPDIAPSVGVTAGDGHLIVAIPVVEGGTTLGTIALKTISEPVAQRLRRAAIISLLAIMASLVVGILVQAQAVLRKANVELSNRASELADLNQRLQAEIGERQKAEEVLRKQRFRQVVESAPSAMVLVNAAGAIEMVNAEAERLFGFKRLELLGRPAEILVPARSRDLFPDQWRALFLDSRARIVAMSGDLFGLRKDGSEFPIECNMSAVETDEGFMALSAIVDISDRIRQEETIRMALREKEILLAEIHHRVKNNLQIVNSLLSLQSATIGNEIALRLLTESRNRIHSMALIHQTLYASKDFGQVNFARFLEDLVSALVSSYGVDPQRVSVSIVAADAALPIGAAIPCGLIVNELVSNALKYAFPGSASGEIRVALVAESGKWFELSVSDNGIGFPPESDTARTPALGLQLVELLAEQLGAEISVHRSDPTRFALRFAVGPGALGPLDREAQFGPSRPQ